MLSGSRISLTLTPNVQLVAALYAQGDGDTWHSTANKHMVLISFPHLHSRHYALHMWSAQNVSSFQSQHICEKEESKSKPGMCLRTSPSECGR